MSDSFNFANPTVGNNIVRSGTSNFYNTKAYFIPPTNLAFVTFPSGSSAPRITALADGGFRLQGTVDVSGPLASDSRIFDIPVDLGVLPSPAIARPILLSTVIVSGEISGVPRGMILRITNSSDVNIAAEVTFKGATTGAVGLGPGDKIFLDFTSICPDIEVQ